MLDVIFRWIIFCTVGVAVLAGPWLFGAWEMWWFWPFVAIICGGIGVVGGRLVSGRWFLRRSSSYGGQAGVSGGGSRSLKLAVACSERCALPLENREEDSVFFVTHKWAVIVLGAVVPFVVYACVRWGMADVFMSAERSVLLHVTGLCVGILVVFGINSRQRRLLFWLMFVNLLLLGIYGVANQLFWDSTYVMWAPRYEQYAGRAMGSYFCPDHFAGIMELLLCMALGVISARRVIWQWKVVAVAAVIASVAGVILSQSRGGIMTLAVIFAVAMVWSFAQWSTMMRWNLRLVAGASALLLLVGMFYFGGDHLDRFASYGGHWGKAGRAAKPEVSSSSVALRAMEDRQEARGRWVEVADDISSVWDALSRTSRGRMYGGAYRAWKSAPWFGIGSGMHQNLWPHFAATTDGDRENGVWPTQHNYYFHSYEVHSDWLQLLEEYGVVGGILFLVPFGFVCMFFISGIRREGRLWQRGDEVDGGEMQFVYLLSGLLTLAAMSFHSLGDFNLQMPATVWILAVVLALGMGEKEPRMDTD